MCPLSSILRTLSCLVLVATALVPLRSIVRRHNRGSLQPKELDDHRVFALAPHLETPSGKFSIIHQENPAQKSENQFHSLLARSCSLVVCSRTRKGILPDIFDCFFVPDKHNAAMQMLALRIHTPALNQRLCMLSLHAATIHLGHQESPILLLIRLRQDRCRLNLCFHESRNVSTQFGVRKCLATESPADEDDAPRSEISQEDLLHIGDSGRH